MLGVLCAVWRALAARRKAYLVREARSLVAVSYTHLDVYKRQAHHMHDGVALADVAQELVAQAGTLAGTLHQTGDVHELHDLSLIHI